MINELVYDFKWMYMDIPNFTLTLRVPKIPGQDTFNMNKMLWKMKISDKGFHRVCNRKQVLQLPDLMAITKDINLIAPIFGKQVKPSNEIVRG